MITRFNLTFFPDGDFDETPSDDGKYVLAEDVAYLVLRIRQALNNVEAKKQVRLDEIRNVMDRYG